ncbi:uncharacterized protein SCDLUD_000816 [Saccharomycodes ludwigii]|uniref:uncharacterized protein n=1 Tax=Saccharomycodes ludwigii TaxID=36035 RepID=UPI001E85C36F|nr:hypothetical protein SCDLUD_000816 [Saccharomycodes ludwigii]KAH3903198.1 hypothetical protein SCDLUD_000816 [Saccharomycodes ludwigii]
MSAENKKETEQQKHNIKEPLKIFNKNGAEIDLKRIRHPHSRHPHVDCPLINNQNHRPKVSEKDINKKINECEKNQEK